MRAVIQRVSRAQVTVDGTVRGSIANGLLVLLGVAADDGDADLAYLVEKTAGLRIFEDDAGKMNRSLEDAKGALLVVSQFTLFGDVRRGRRPSFDNAAPPQVADALYQRYVELLRGKGLKVETGVFQAMMKVELVNDGPVTILLDSKKLF
jgi:D-tyrosyl-tRNA(Tyr) deacylase